MPFQTELIHVRPAWYSQYTAIISLNSNSMWSLQRRKRVLTVRCSRYSLVAPARQSGIWIPGEKRNLPLIKSIKTSSGAHPGYSIDDRVLSRRRYGSWGVKVTTHFQPVQRVETRGARVQLLLYVFMSWTGKFHVMDREILPLLRDIKCNFL